MVHLPVSEKGAEHEKDVVRQMGDEYQSTAPNS